MRERVHLVDTEQSFWQLAVIQLAGWMSLPILATSILILDVNSLGGAILTVIVGNAILWFIRLGILAMSYEGRQSTLDIARGYLGWFGSYFIAGLLLISTLAWFIAQTRSASGTLTHLISIHENGQIDQYTQLSVLLGITSAFLCMEGIVLLRRISTLIFPVLFVAFFVIIFTLPSWNLHGNGKELSLAGLSLVLATNLGITADLPTFFRHSKSWNESIKGLTVVQLVSLALGICSLCFGSIITEGFGVNEEVILSSGNEVLRTALVIFVFLSAICANVANVYSASVGWEVVAPKALVGRKEYLILGLILTTIFILVSNTFSPDWLLNVSDCALVNLSLVLVLGFMMHRALKRGPSRMEQGFYFLAWVVATGVNGMQLSDVFSSGFSPVLYSLMIVLGFVSMPLLLGKVRK
jgi:purine-cytosine permease-like protein